jgi:hypothetical protein
MGFLVYVKQLLPFNPIHPDLETVRHQKVIAEYLIFSFVVVFLMHHWYSGGGVPPPPARTVCENRLAKTKQANGIIIFFFIITSSRYLKCKTILYVLFGNSAST